MKVTWSNKYNFSSIFQISFNPKGIRLVTRLTLKASIPQNGQIYSNNSSAICISSHSHLILRHPLFHAKRSTLLNNMKEIDSALLNKSESVVTRILLYGDESCKDKVNLLILNATIDFLLSRNRFNKPLYLITFSTILQFSKF